MKTLSKKTTRARDNNEVILICAKLNLRELPMSSKGGANYPALCYDSTKNKILAGPSTAAEVAALAKSLISAAGVRAIRVNATMAVELVFSLPVSFYADSNKYFSESLQWAVDYFQVPVLSAVCHFDRVQPHMHMLLLPLRAGNGSVPACSVHVLPSVRCSTASELPSRCRMDWAVRIRVNSARPLPSKSYVASRESRTS